MTTWDDFTRVLPQTATTGKHDPYAAELWEQTCYEGDEHHIDGIKSLGFKWYFGEKPPAAK